MIPQTATDIDGLKYFLSKPRSLSSPAININKITPISEKVCTKSFSTTQPKTAGPKMIPTNNCPITAGIPIRRLKCPAKAVDNSTRHRIPKCSIIIFPSPLKATNSYSYSIFNKINYN
jgi:hypothetical protein